VVDHTFLDSSKDYSLDSNLASIKAAEALDRHLHSDDLKMYLVKVNMQRRNLKAVDSAFHNTEDNKARH
jgi:hypothetical protein